MAQDLLDHRRVRMGSGHQTVGGKLTRDEPFPVLVRESGCEELAVALGHTEQLRTLPPHHTDPFDRMLIAQARAEGVTLVTHDRQCGPYEVPIFWV